MATVYIKKINVPALQQDKNLTVDSLPNPDFVRYFNDTISNLTTIINTLTQQVFDQQQIIDRLVRAEDQIQKANTVITSNALQAKLIGSYTDPAGVLTASVPDANNQVTITVADHTRVYADSAKTRVAVKGGTITGLLPGTGYAVFYNDSTQVGGTVKYIASTNGNDAFQTGAVHSVGTIDTPATATDPPSSGGGSGGSGTGPRCIAATAMLHDYTVAEDLEVGHEVMILDYDNDHFVFGEIIALDSSYEACSTIVTESGIELTVSNSTPVQIWTGETIPVLHVLGHEVATMDDGVFCWEEVVELRPAGVRRVIQLDCGDKNYAAGDKPDRLIFTHNKPISSSVPNSD